MGNDKFKYNFLFMTSKQNFRRYLDLNSAREFRSSILRHCRELAKVYVWSVVDQEYIPCDLTPGKFEDCL